MGKLVLHVGQASPIKILLGGSPELFHEQALKVGRAQPDSAGDFCVWERLIDRLLVQDL